jgi:hypothetical protein
MIIRLPPGQAGSFKKNRILARRFGKNRVFYDSFCPYGNSEFNRPGQQKRPESFRPSVTPLPFFNLRAYNRACCSSALKKNQNITAYCLCMTGSFIAPAS